MKQRCTCNQCQPEKREPTPFSKAFPPINDKLPDELAEALANWRPTKRLVLPRSE